MVINGSITEQIYLTFHDYNDKYFVICDNIKDGWNKQSNLLRYNEDHKIERFRYIRIRRSKPNKQYNKLWYNI